ncbi:TPA: hypothetical protein RQK75_002254 [Vibrio vulnificus]|nr:hypothetical protein [Vibrio vulnificus]
MSATSHITKDPHSLVYATRQSLGCLANMAAGNDGKIENLTGEQLYFLLSSLGEDLDVALAKMEAE